MRAETLAAFVVLGAVSAGCVSDQERIAQEQRIEAAREQNAAARAALESCKSNYATRNRDNAVPFAECVLNAANMFVPKPNEIQYAIIYKRLALAHDFADGRLTLEQYQSEFMSYAAVMNSKLEMQRNEERIAIANEKAANAATCISAQLRQSNTDYSGVDSRYGAVAIVSLIGEVADSIDTAKACQ
jgi:hypothetical protein